MPKNNVRQFYKEKFSKLIANKMNMPFKNKSKWVAYKLCVMVHSCLHGLHHSTWSTSAYQSLTSLLGSIADPPVNDSWFFRDCKRTADGLSPLLAHRPGTHCLTIWEIRVSAETASVDYWRYICSLCTEAPSALEVVIECAIQILLLTYLPPVWKVKHALM